MESDIMLSLQLSNVDCQGKESLAGTDMSEGQLARETKQYSPPLY